MDAVLGDDQHYWNAVSLDIWIPWFLVTIEELSIEDASFATTLFVHSERQIANLIAMGDILVVRIQKVKPSKDKHRGWQFEEVLAVRAATRYPKFESRYSYSTREETEIINNNLIQAQGNDENLSIIWQRPIIE